MVVPTRREDVTEITTSACSQIRRPLTQERVFLLREAGCHSACAEYIYIYISRAAKHTTGGVGVGDRVGGQTLRTGLRLDANEAALHAAHCGGRQLIQSRTHVGGRWKSSKSLNGEPCEIRFNGVIFCVGFFFFYVTVGQLRLRRWRQ